MDHDNITTHALTSRQRMSRSNQNKDKKSRCGLSASCHSCTSCISCLPRRYSSPSVPRKLCVRSNFLFERVSPCPIYLSACVAPSLCLCLPLCLSVSFSVVGRGKKNEINPRTATSVLRTNLTVTTWNLEHHVLLLLLAPSGWRAHTARNSEPIAWHITCVRTPHILTSVWYTYYVEYTPNY